MTTAEYADGLRLLADFYDAHPETLLPYESGQLGELHFNLSDRAEIESVVRAFGGKWTKETAGGLFYAHGVFGPFRLRVYANQAAVCKRVQVGVQVIPAEPERVRPATPEREEPQYEWQCGSVLAEAVAADECGGMEVEG